MGQHVIGHPPDETNISILIDMGFSRSEAKQALRHVKLVMEWLFRYLEEPAQEDDELARALALSLDNSDMYEIVAKYICDCFFHD